MFFLSAYSSAKMQPETITNVDNQAGVFSHLYLESYSHPRNLSLIPVEVYTLGYCISSEVYRKKENFICNDLG
jgi:hypothetical protein